MIDDTTNNVQLKRAAQWLREADGLLITAGAGMGVDSGLPDFRGDRGFWQAYPALKVVSAPLQAIANPATFRKDPLHAWGFYGHRLNLYRNTCPHDGFDMLKKRSQRMAYGSFVFTSNVDGQFQKAGFPESRVAECHGSIHWLQCVHRCSADIWPADGFAPTVNEAQCRLLSSPPVCPKCGSLARPNILMFSDSDWVDSRTDRQLARLRGWLSSVRSLVVIEIGAGKAIPTVRNASERHGPRVIRINPREYAINPLHGVGIAGTALHVLSQLDDILD